MAILQQTTKKENSLCFDFLEMTTSFQHGTKELDCKGLVQGIQKLF